MARTRLKELQEAAEELSKLTGENYKIVPLHQTVKLVKVRPNSTTHDDVYHEESNSELLGRIISFHAGIEEGMRKAKKPDTAILNTEDAIVLRKLAEAVLESNSAKTFCKGVRTDVKTVNEIIERVKEATKTV